MLPFLGFNRLKKYNLIIFLHKQSGDRLQLRHFFSPQYSAIGHFFYASLYSCLPRYAPDREGLNSGIILV
jgi:hypothetical protein